MGKPGRRGLGGQSLAPRVCALASRGHSPRGRAPVSKGRFCWDRSVGISLLGRHGGGGRNKCLVIVVGTMCRFGSDAWGESPGVDPQYRGAMPHPQEAVDPYGSAGISRHVVVGHVGQPPSLSQLDAGPTVGGRLHG